MKGLIAFVVISIVLLALWLMAYLGVFKDVAISVGEAGPFRVVYKVHTGPYHKIVPVIEEVERWATANGETCQTSFGEYLEDPQMVDEDRLHSNGGCLVTKDWSAVPLPTGFIYKEIPPRLYVNAEFDGAPSIGPQKVYPRVGKIAAEQGLKTDGPTIELYERVGARGLLTHYHFPVKKQ